MAMGLSDDPCNLVILSTDAVRSRDLAAHLESSRLARFQCVAQQDVAGVLSAVPEPAAALVIIDAQTPQDVCLQAIERLSESAPHVAIVWLLAQDDPAPIEALPTSEALDFLVWPSVLPADHLLLQSLRRHRMRARLQERKAELRTLVYGITHDLRAPLITLDYLLDDADTALKEVDPEHGSRLNDTVARSRRVVDQMSIFVEQIVRLAEISSAPPADEPIRLDELVRTLQDDLGPMADRRHVSIEIDAPDATILADRTRFYHLMQNLLHNAIQHTPRGTSVAVLGENVDPGDPGGPLRIAVVDGGPGLGAAPGAGTPVQELMALGGRPGHGLGLRLAVLAAAHHNAVVRVDVHPRLGGAMFYFDLPAGRVVRRSNGHEA